MKVSFEGPWYEFRRYAELLGLGAAASHAAESALLRATLGRAGKAGQRPGPTVANPPPSPPIPPPPVPPVPPAPPPGVYGNITIVTENNGVVTYAPAITKLPDPGGTLGWSAIDNTYFRVL